MSPFDLKRNLPLNSMLLLDLCGEPGSGKLGIGRDLKPIFVGCSKIASFFLSPLRSVFSAKPLGCVILGGADFRSMQWIAYVDLGRGRALKVAAALLSTEDLGSLVCFAVLKLNSLNFVASCLVTDFFSEVKSCETLSNIFLFRGSALNEPLF